MRRYSSAIMRSPAGSPSRSAGKAERSRMLEEENLSDEELRALGDLIPGPEPVLETRIPRHPVSETAGRIIPVADTRLDGNELRYLTQCVQSNWISSAGRFVKEFETHFARAMDCRFGIACAN